MFSSKKRGFTLIELLTVVSIVGLLSSLVLSVVNDTRKKADVKQANQIADEYRKALTLYYDENGGYPPTITNLTYCLGDFSVTGIDVCGAALLPAGSYALDEDTILNDSTTGIGKYYPSLPIMKEVFYTNSLLQAYKWKGPWYTCTAPLVGGKCASASLRWRLGLPNQQCIRGVTPNVTSPNSTFCSLTLN